MVVEVDVQAVVLVVCFVELGALGVEHAHK